MDAWNVVIKKPKKNDGTLNIKNLIVTAGAKGSYAFSQKSKKNNYCQKVNLIIYEKILLPIPRPEN